MNDTLRDNKLDSLSTNNHDMKRRRTINASAAEDPNDYIIKQQLDDALSKIKKSTGVVSGGIPNGLTYTPTVVNYSSLTFKNVGVTNSNDMIGIDFYLITIDELLLDVFMTTTGTVSSSTTPVTVNVTKNPAQTTLDATLQFIVGDYVLFNDPGHYEWARVTVIVDHGGGSFTFTLERTGLFGSSLAAHAIGTKLFIGRARRFTQLTHKQQAFQPAALNNFTFYIPNACVGAVVGIPYSLNGSGSPKIINNASATVPGLRTCFGGEFSFQIDNAAADAGAPVAINNFSIDLKQTQRVNFAYSPADIVSTDLVINIILSDDLGASWITVETLTIPVGFKYSWPTGSPPSGQQTPYAGAWPFMVLSPGEQLNFTIEAGSTTGLTIKLNT